MNLSISLLRRTGLTHEQVAEITRDLDKSVGLLTKDVEKVHTDLNFWKQQLRKQTPTKKCTKCKGEIEVWPFNNVAYYIKGSRVTHQTCPTKEKS